MNNTIYITGHKNPDTDSICSALAYANMKNLIGETAIACRLGPLNEESKYVLKRFGLENPLLLKDARSILSDIDIDEPLMVPMDTSVKEAWDKMLSTSNRSLVVVDKRTRIKGIISTSNLSMTRLMLDTDVNGLMAQAKLKKIAQTIEGKVVFDGEEYKTNGKVYIVTLHDREKFQSNFKGSICILSDGEEKQISLIEAGCKLLVITCGQEVSPRVINAARVKQCAIITCESDTMKVAKVINDSYPVSLIMTKNPIFFRHHEYVEDVIKKMSNTRFRSYPVVDDENHVIGQISRYHLQNYKRRRFILVDHSAKNQSINNIDDAEILEIIDHHHIGNIETTYPIYYRNQKCGCTCTIISMLYQENGLLPDAQYSGILLSAIISDTLHFKSATTTPLDIMTAKWLADRAGVNLEEYALEMLSASVALKDLEPTKILNRDLKTYDIGKYKLAIGQTNYRNIEDIQAILADFRKNLEKEQKAKGYDLVIMMFTHVMAEGTMFVYSGPLSYLMDNVLDTKFDDHSGYSRDIISRKQQLMPKMSALLKEI
ncbi:putative manganese-dependent inorganic diphosphatase [Erysipelotrichaceae bacterium OH741_COT-311]|nr:putative manganese-dependent inorganic diphosphatase [Erysipelotrichaceae bacterium OH741_COT-311]